MNHASRAVIRWLLLKESQPSDEIERFLDALARGVEKREQDSIEMVGKLLAAGRIAAHGTDQQADIEELLELHEKLAQIDLAEKAATAIGTVATILEKPPRSNLEVRIKSNLIAKTLEPFSGAKASHT
jgi:hypothetical protein